VDNEKCEACGFDGGGYSDAALVQSFRDLGPTWHALVASCGDELRVRPAPEVWSALEYAAHSRDITALHAFGVNYALSEDEAALPGIDGDSLIQEAAAAYRDADADAVVAELATEAARLADLAVTAGDAMRRRGLTVGTERSTVRRMLEHALHDSLHHVIDVERGLAVLRKGAG